MNIFLLLLILFLVFFCCGGCWQYRPRVEAYLRAAHEFWGFNGAVSISKNGRLLFSQGYGLANQQMGEPNTPNTRFFIGSITKQFTAAAILALQEDHLLNLDDPITKYLADYPHDPGDRITIKNLLTHTSGIPNYTEDPEIILRRTQSISPKEIIKKIEKRPLEFEPGIRFKYSNSGYILLGRIIEIASGQSFEAYLHRRIFRPAGMKNTGYGRRESAVPDRAEGYTLSRNGSIVDAIPVDYSILYSAGALYSTVEDISKWDRALNTGRIIGKSSIDDMFSSHFNNYGYGWYLEGRFGRRHAYHSGFLDGFNTTIDRWLDDSLCIVVFSNEDESPVSKIASGLAAIAFDKPYAMPAKKRPIWMNPNRFREYEGIYLIDTGLYVYVSYQEDALYTHMRGMSLQVLQPQANDTFFYSSDNNKLLTFGRKSDGSINRLRIIDDECVYAANRLSGDDSAALFINRNVISIDSNSLQQYTGVYEVKPISGSVGDGLVLTITNLGDHLELSVVSNESVALFPSSETTFFQKESDLQMTFSRDELGKIAGCIIDIASVKLHAVKVD